MYFRGQKHVKKEISISLKNGHQILRWRYYFVRNYLKITNKTQETLRKWQESSFSSISRLLIAKLMLNSWSWDNFLWNCTLVLFFSCFEIFWNYLWSTNGISVTSRKFLAAKLTFSIKNMFLSLKSVFKSLKEFSSYFHAKVKLDQRLEKLLFSILKVYVRQTSWKLRKVTFPMSNRALILHGSSCWTP